MSYSIIKKIEITDNKIYLTTASNNVRPLCFIKWECKPFTKILQEKGLDEVELEIFRQYEEGNFQRGNNKYTRRLGILLNMPEYMTFDWRLDNTRNARETEAFNILLRQALNSKLPKNKYIIRDTTLSYDNKIHYLWRIYKRISRFTTDKNKAKVFRYEAEAQKIANFIKEDSLIVEKIN